MVDFKEISIKWQRRWEEAKIFHVNEDSHKKKYYVLEMYPYPSASYLHMGHVRNFTIGDVYARFKRMLGFNVLYPMGFDSFGLPAETAAKKEGIHPKKYTEQAIEKIMEYFKALGNSYDWSKTLSSHEPEYYKWNQFFFLKLLEKGLAYRKKAPVNWCPKCESVLANEESEGGKCWRCEGDVTVKELDQWFFKITAYADRLLEDLKKIDWPEKIKTMQENWIGRSEGAIIEFPIEGSDKKLTVFTTRPDTFFGITFLVYAPEHPDVLELIKGTKDEENIKKFIKKVTQEDRFARTAEDKEKEGIFLGKYAINPITKEKIPIYIANFVLHEYGTGAIIAVPAHDQRDFEFAKKYNIPIKIVINPSDFDLKPDKMQRAYISDGTMINSQEFDGKNNRDAIPEFVKFFKKHKCGGETVQYKIRDWLISRQRYWGTPIPIIYCDKCGVVPVAEKELPVLLPEKVDFKSKTNPLTTNLEFVNTKCPKCGGSAKRETDTMGGFVDSSWYFLRYCDNKNKEKPFDSHKVNYWMPVDQYVGGAEHAVMHLIYARFFVKALKDLGFVKFDEPFSKLFNQGIVYKDGAKMSKSKGNIVSQTQISDEYGIDTARLFLMFVSSPDKQMEWSDEGVEGAYRIINKLIRLKDSIVETNDKKQDNKINITIKKVTENIENFEYPKAVIALIEAIDYFSSKISKFGNSKVFSKLEISGEISKENYEILLKLISPFCPHIAEEMWHEIGNKPFISIEKWPEYDERKIDEEIEFAEQFVEKTIFDIKNVIELTKIKPKKIKIIIAAKWKRKFMLEFKKELEKSRDLKVLMQKFTKEFSENAKDIAKIIPSLLKDESKMPTIVLSQDKEAENIHESAEKIKGMLNSEIIVEKEENSKEAKAGNAMPNKAAIVLE